MIEDKLRRRADATREIPAWLEREPDPDIADRLRWANNLITALYGIGLLGLAVTVGVALI